jgi:hypothetical protein
MYIFILLYFIVAECRLVPSPGRCLDSQKKSVYTYSDKLGVCVEITGCYDFHDRNVWRTVDACNERCHVNVSVIPDLSNYDIALGKAPLTSLWFKIFHFSSFFTFGVSKNTYIKNYEYVMYVLFSLSHFVDLVNCKF